MNRYITKHQLQMHIDAQLRLASMVFGNNSSEFRRTMWRVRRAKKAAMRHLTTSKY